MKGSLKNVSFSSHVLYSIYSFNSNQYLISIYLINSHIKVRLMQLYGHYHKITSAHYPLCSWKKRSFWTSPLLHFCCMWLKHKSPFTFKEGKFPTSAHEAPVHLYMSGNPYVYICWGSVHVFHIKFNRLSNRKLAGMCTSVKYEVKPKYK